MVTITKEGSHFIFTINGLHKLWALKSSLTIPAEHIVKAYPNDKNLKGMIGLRMPGTHVPGLITAGTYWADEGTIFCDVVHADKAIAIDLRDEHYKRLIIEVEDPEEAIKMLMY